MNDTNRKESTSSELLAAQAELEAVNVRVSAIEEAASNYGEHLRLLNEAVSNLQIAFAQTAENLTSLQSDQKINPVDNSDLIQSMLLSRTNFVKERTGLSTTLPKKVKTKTFAEQLAEVKAIGYGSFAEWFKLLEPNLESYVAEPEAGVSVEENKVANWFRYFVAPYSKGNVADIGCGICSMPVYLKHFEANLIVGMDPIAPEFDRDFEFYHGLAETLPWRDESLDNVIVATSMDHVLDPRKCLHEIKRVLKPNGFLLLWMGFLPDTEPYNPFLKDQKPVDDYHMFHFSQNWFEDLLEEEFLVEESVTVNPVSTFYSARIKPSK